jgi:hypothetical protein
VISTKLLASGFGVILCVIITTWLILFITGSTCSFFSASPPSVGGVEVESVGVVDGVGLAAAVAVGSPPAPSGAFPGSRLRLSIKVMTTKRRDSRW